MATWLDDLADEFDAKQQKAALERDRTALHSKFIGDNKHPEFLKLSGWMVTIGQHINKRKGHEIIKTDRGNESLTVISNNDNGVFVLEANFELPAGAVVWSVRHNNRNVESGKLLPAMRPGGVFAYQEMKEGGFGGTTQETAAYLARKVFSRE